jgi:hypothetical protein
VKQIKVTPARGSAPEHVSGADTWAEARAASAAHRQRRSRRQQAAKAALTTIGVVAVPAMSIAGTEAGRGVAAMAFIAAVYGGGFVAMAER